VYGTSVVSYSNLKRTSKEIRSINWQHAQNAMGGCGLAALTVSARSLKFPALGIRDARIAIYSCFSAPNTSSDHTTFLWIPRANQVPLMNPDPQQLRPKVLVFQVFQLVTDKL
jgi:hypothetical protein